ncbi:hypothetical protein CfE428DRAFT_2413 [Chthoniobacter flavus Ellin428]|uniref:Uncharacterized protein n=1 Tax=Chthoniobacter flavus Ellin428 TaxID=497964 RepID=B4D0G2_9BACT|nr:hypothetical protein [Chthoniobacter flavus]EDY19824.1 hypothetical protein CfE428DRAFT_2413 [Chthoniobacter flavus Ellin428]TCO91902.1 hypothetical protein EV701_107183 [Chthoniobacter flavus]
MTPSLSITHPLPAYIGWQACFARVEMFVPVFVHLAKVNRQRPTQGCYSMTD